jgi:hypothetical protein
MEGVGNPKKHFTVRAKKGLAQDIDPAAGQTVENDTLNDYGFAKNGNYNSSAFQRKSILRNYSGKLQTNSPEKWTNEDIQLLHLDGFQINLDTFRSLEEKINSSISEDEMDEDTLKM